MPKHELYSYTFHQLQFLCIGYLESTCDFQLHFKFQQSEYLDLTVLWVGLYYYDINGMATSLSIWEKELNTECMV